MRTFSDTFFHFLGIFVPDQIRFGEILTDCVALTPSENWNFLRLTFIRSFCQKSNFRLYGGRRSDLLIGVFDKAIFNNLKRFKWGPIFIIQIVPIWGVLYFRYGIKIWFETCLICFWNQTTIIANIFGYLWLYLLDQIKFILLGQIIKENQLIIFVSLTKFRHRIEIYGVFESVHVIERQEFANDFGLWLSL